MARDRWEEILAARCIAAELGVKVAVHDDGSADSMHDLNIAYTDRAAGAVEVTTAADPDCIALGRFVFGGERWIEAGLAGGWGVSLKPTAKWKTIRAKLPDVLAAMEARGIREARPDIWWEPAPYDEVLRGLGITHLFQSESTSFPGSIYLTIDQGIERTAGVVPTDGAPLLRWLSKWIARPDKADNLRKLAASGADERHLFLILPGFADAPFEVTDLLMRDGAPLPDDAPELPPAVTHIWTVSTWTTGAGMRWAPGEGWPRFEKRFEPSGSS